MAMMIDLRTGKTGKTIDELPPGARPLRFDPARQKYLAAEKRVASLTLGERLELALNEIALLRARVEVLEKIDRKK